MRDGERSGSGRRRSRSGEGRRRIVTMGYLVAQDMLIRMNCYRCRHVATLDPLPFAITHGDGTELQAILEAAVCSRCGARHPDVDCQVTHRIAPATKEWGDRNSDAGDHR